MANFSPSNLVAAQTRLKDMFTQPEMREKLLPTIQLGIQNKDVMVQSVEDLRKREDRPVYGYSMVRVSSATGSVRTFNHTGARGDSQQLAFSWNTYSQTFSISLKQLDTNVFTFNDALAQGFKNCILDIHDAIETDAIAYLLSNRNQVVQTTTPVGSRVNWNATNYFHEIGTSDSKQFTQLIKAVMRSNKYNGNQFNAIYDNQTEVNAAFWMSQGGGNQQNTMFQFTGMNINPSIELADSNYSNGVALVMQPGTYGMIPWIPKQNREGYGDFNTEVGGYGSLIDPLTNTGSGYSGGLVFAIHGYTQRANTASANGVQQDNLMEFEVSVDIANALTPLSTANESVVYAFAQM
jgi:hypothetical protein